MSPPHPHQHTSLPSLSLPISQSHEPGNKRRKERREGEEEGRRREGEEESGGHPLLLVHASDELLQLPHALDVAVVGDGAPSTFFFLTFMEDALR
jgi:hypothetical protein